MIYKGDFHLHTTYSDGEHSPKEVVEIASNNGFNIISITDHNNINGLEEAKQAGDILGVKIIPGVEISSRYNGEKIHLLGYFNNNQYIYENLKKALKAIRGHNIRELEKIIGNNINVEEDSIKNRISVVTAIEILKFFGAKVILAHPIKIKRTIIEPILKLKWDGIEARYFKNKESETEEFIRLCEERRWIYTAGSDFHTNKKEDKRHGKIGDVYLEHKEVIKFLYEISN